MPGFTSPNNIQYPVVGDKLSPLNTWFATLASSTQAAITSLRNEFTLPAYPSPLSIEGATQQAVTATSWADLPNADAISLVLTRACWVQITHGAWVVAGGTANTRMSSRVTGATTLGESQLEVGGSTTAWGQVLYSDSTSGTRQSSGVRMVRLNAGTNTIRLRAYRGGSGASQVNYSTLQVSPIRWA